MHSIAASTKALLHGALSSVLVFSIKVQQLLSTVIHSAAVVHFNDDKHVSQTSTQISSAQQFSFYYVCFAWVCWLVCLVTRITIKVMNINEILCRIRPWNKKIYWIWGII